MADALPHEIAASRTAEMSDANRSDFLTAFYRVRELARRNGDLDGLWSRAAHDPNTSAATLAGLVEGLAAGRGARV